MLAGTVLGSLLPLAFLALQAWGGLGFDTLSLDRAGGPATQWPAPGASPHELAGRLLFPVPAVSTSAMSDSFDDTRGPRTHLAVDIAAPRGSPVVAVSDGTLARMSRSAAGGLGLYLLDASGRYCYFYAHLERYAESLSEGRPVKRGQLLAYVGSSGNAPSHLPHLHFAIAMVRAPAQCWGGPGVDPYPLWG